MWLEDDADDEVAEVISDVAVEPLAVEADVAADVTAVDAALALEVVPEVADAAVEVAPAEQPAALGRLVTPAPAQSCSANWRVASRKKFRC